jgi:hypothetical protein
MELMKLARLTIDEFSEIPASAKDEVVQDLVDGLESIFQEYIFFVASCGKLILCCVHTSLFSWLVVHVKHG